MCGLGGQMPSGKPEKQYCHFLQQVKTTVNSHLADTRYYDKIPIPGKCGSTELALLWTLNDVPRVSAIRSVSMGFFISFYPVKS